MEEDAFTLFKPAGSRLDFYHMSGDGLMRASVGTDAGALGEGVHNIDLRPPIV